MPLSWEWIHRLCVGVLELIVEIPLEPLWVGMSGVADSETFWVVWGVGDHGDEAAHEAAVAFVESAVVPEPGALGLAGLTAAGALLRRRHRKVC